jgi:hypothetical protein
MVAARVVQVVRVGIRSWIDFPPVESSRRILDSSRFLSQEFIHAEFLYGIGLYDLDRI